MFFVFVKIVFSLLEIIEPVTGGRSLGLPGDSCFTRRLAALLMLVVQRTDVLQIPDFFFLPALQDFVCILETGLTGLQNSTVTGFLDNFYRKT